MDYLFLINFSPVDIFVFLPSLLDTKDILILTFSQREEDLIKNKL